jgi:hypothetical protein
LEDGGINRTLLVHDLFMRSKCNMFLFDLVIFDL